MTVQNDCPRMKIDKEELLRDKTSALFESACYNNHRSRRNFIPNSTLYFSTNPSSNGRIACLVHIGMSSDF